MKNLSYNKLKKIELISGAILLFVFLPSIFNVEIPKSFSQVISLIAMAIFFTTTTVSFVIQRKKNLEDELSKANEGKVAIIAISAMSVILLFIAMIITAVRVKLTIGFEAVWGVN